MSRRIHFIVARSRGGWSVNLESDRLSEHARREDACACARHLAEHWDIEGETAQLVDLSQDAD